MVKRETVKAIEDQKHQMIAALYANSAFDESKEGVKARQERISSIEEHFNKAIELVYNPSLHEKGDIDWDNPFWAAAKRAQQRRTEMFRGDKKATVGDVIAEDQTDDEETTRPTRPDVDQM